MSTTHIEAVRSKNDKAKREGSKNDLVFYERQIIEVRVRSGWSMRRVADYLHRPASTVCREINRNSKPCGTYSAKYAQEQYESRLKTTNTKKLLKLDNRKLMIYVIDKIKKEQWSPDQVAGRLDSKFAPARLEGKTVSHETIYKFIYDTTVGTHLYKYLRKKSCAQRKSWQGRSSSTVGTVRYKTPIDERPEVVDKRERIGDWESDTMKCSQGGHVSVQSERNSMLVQLTQVYDMSAIETEKAIEHSIESLPDCEFHTITFDNGTENANHYKLRDKYNVDTYFCEPYRSWQKGSVENMIGLVRQYLPNETDLSKLPEDKLREIQEKLNNRPRKSLNYLTPKEYVNQELNT